MLNSPEVNVPGVKEIREAAAKGDFSPVDYKSRARPHPESLGS
jgi:hypothetical protein